MSVPRPPEPSVGPCGDHVARGLKLLLEAHGRKDVDGFLDSFAAMAELQAAAAQLAVRIVNAAWDELSSFQLPVLALGDAEAFLITGISGNVARVRYPLLGEFTLLRPWVEERWSGQIAFFGPAALLWTRHVG
ncbi:MULTISPECIES: hypothetical protein [Sphingomonas]|uniref:hypothetical protein n=1 Tax=Sphingomonas TaxID=13687 RepID=UPI0015EBC6C4|nr:MULTISPECIES: hypothetical protein [Sphingomonas]MBA2919986.1 hypothetical protein [Sphingomonas sp. CGMCC 1.13658]